MDNNYSNEVLKISVARACTAFGFNHIHQSALESLTDIVRHYIESIGAGAKDSAESSERVFAGIQDVIPILESTVSDVFSFNSIFPPEIM